MMKKIFLSLAIAMCGYCAYAQTVLTVNSNDELISNNKIVINTTVGQSFFTGHQIGASYSYPSAIFTAISDNPTYPNYLYHGIKNNVLTYSIRSDGQGYFAGAVGIGTQNPGSDLTITRGGAGVSIHTIGGGYYGSLAFNREAATGAIFNSSGSAFQINNGNGTDKNLHIQVYNGVGGMINPDALIISGTTSGIGINTAIVPIGYQLAVNGAVVATSMTVKLYANWPDYVFKKDYRLPLLADVKTYIHQNHHLPEIPSATEIEQNGLNLSEMNLKLLKKIEELTLYTIQQKEYSESLKEENKKLIDEQQKINQAQELRIAALEKALSKLSAQ